MVVDAAVNHHKCIFVGEGGFNVTKTRRRGRNLIGQPSKCLDNVGETSPCAQLGCRPFFGSYNAAYLHIVFLNEIVQACQGEGVTYVIVWENVRFHRAEVVRAWFRAYPRFVTLYLPPYSPFLNPIEEKKCLA
jgi:hypothetical protein